MRNAIGFLIVLWGLSQFSASAFDAANNAARETFRVVELAALQSQQHLSGE